MELFIDRVYPFLRLRKANSNPQSEDSKQIWLWRNEESARSVSRNKEEISWSDHQLWYGRQELKRSFWIIERLNQAAEAASISIGIGSARLDYSQVEGSAEISLILAPTWRGKGLGQIALSQLCELAFTQLNLKKLQATIQSDNAGSIKLFMREGFQKIAEGDFALYEKTKQGD